mmetsp:Transcript_22856/g.65900  ORF Transcript_22856/g.65900 Transcript_22856/m.65900 type:complete len:397 (+) Transcript_22856:966-2156(+)
MAARSLALTAAIVVLVPVKKEVMASLEAELPRALTVHVLLAGQVGRDLGAPLDAHPGLAVAPDAGEGGVGGQLQLPSDHRPADACPAPAADLGVLLAHELLGVEEARGPRGHTRAAPELDPRGLQHGALAVHDAGAGHDTAHGLGVGAAAVGLVLLPVVRVLAVLLLVRADAGHGPRAHAIVLELAKAPALRRPLAVELALLRPEPRAAHVLAGQRGLDRAVRAGAHRVERKAVELHGQFELRLVLVARTQEHHGLDRLEDRVRDTATVVVEDVLARARALLAAQAPEQVLELGVAAPVRQAPQLALRVPGAVLHGLRGEILLLRSALAEVHEPRAVEPLRFEAGPHAVAEGVPCHAIQQGLELLGGTPDLDEGHFGQAHTSLHHGRGGFIAAAST